MERVILCNHNLYRFLIMSLVMKYHVCTVDRKSVANILGMSSGVHSHKDVTRV